MLGGIIVRDFPAALPTVADSVGNAVDLASLAVNRDFYAVVPLSAGTSALVLKHRIGPTEPPWARWADSV